MKKYEDIVHDIEQKLMNEPFASGQKLPSVRAAALHYGCSVSTVTRAYAELENRHLIYSIAQSGYYAVGKSRDASGSFENRIIDFASVSPDPGVFPFADFRHCLNRALDTYQHELFTCGDSLGLRTLRRQLVSHLANDQVFANEERIIVTPGANRALEILAKMPFPSGSSVVLVEQPSYDLYLRFLEAENIPVRGIARTTAGIDLEELEKAFKHGGIKFFYTMPRYHSPLGASYSVNQRKAIAQLASRYGVYIVEDDYMADLGDEPGAYPLYAYNETSHVAYVKSFSKIIFPGLRIGAVVLPEKLMQPFSEYKRYADTSQLSQAALEMYMRNGMYDRHKRKISSQYAERLHVLHTALHMHGTEGMMGAADVRTGVYLPLPLPRTVNLERLTDRLAAKGIQVVSGKSFYLSTWLEREKFLRISVARARTVQIEEGVREIVREVRRELGSLT
ncbi:aminotransferase-like domain-containing protein [Paenibacillus soyae]|uniref:PLP-dependent aminotransferase family protein n=1 Tax=Paenibacillus soyae TaxID=2969249 RepID=A0A9X2N058_9BACL|nr:PLP-dependent aminotransferase family protein [Paenibacillus soyae]